MTRKTLTLMIAGVTLAASVATTTRPALAWDGWVGPAIAGGVIGGLALGAAAASGGYAYGPAYAYGPGYGCVASQPVYDSWGNFRGYRRIRVAC